MPLTVISPTCEYTEEALGIGTQNPVFGWKLSSDAAGAKQTAYRVAVFDENGDEIWDSGKTVSEAQFGVVMTPAKKLLPMSEYTFSVTVWDENDVPSPSATSRFVTGFFKAHQWQSDWLRIWHYGSVRYFRHEFTVRSIGSVRSAYAFTGAFGDKGNSCVAYLNGRKIGDSVCFPGAAEYFRAKYFCADVKDMLKDGKNAVGLMLARTASIIIKIKYRDGSEEIVDCRSEEWKTKTGGYRLGYAESMQHGKAEEYDARSAFDGWSESGFDDSDWEPAGEKDPVIDLAPLFLEPQLSTAKIARNLSPVKITALKGGYLADFGTNLAGFVSVRAKGKTGETVEIRYSEKLDEAGSPVYDGWRGAYAKYTFASDKEEEYTPAFMYTGFRYAAVFGCDGQPELTAHSIHSDVECRSRFECSDEDINAICETARKSFLSNLINIPTDCPERERRGWTADAYAVCEAECVSLNVHGLYAQWLESMRDCQRGNGWIPVELPLSTDDCIDVNWPAASVLIPFTLYRQYGDERLVKRCVPMMKAWVDLLLEISEDGRFIPERYMSYKDWMAKEPASAGFLATAYFFRCADLLSKLTDGDDAEHYSGIARDIREAINGKYLNVKGSETFYDNGSQSSNAHALYFGLCPEGLRPAVTAHLVADVERKQTSTCGFMGTMCLLEALSQNGRNDVAYRLIKNKNEGGWLYLINECGATTFPEHFNGGGSQNHAFLGSAPVLWAYKRLAGISPEAPGYKIARVEPYIPDDTEHASATVETLYGAISASWRKTASGVKLSVTLPPNVTGIVVFDGKTHDVPSGTHEFDF